LMFVSGWAARLARRLVGCGLVAVDTSTHPAPTSIVIIRGVLGILQPC